MVYSPNTSTEFKLEPIDDDNKNLLGYYAISTANKNVDESEVDVHDVHKELQEIADYLVNNDKPEIIVSIHGYSSEYDAAKKVYKDTYNVAKNYFSDQEKCVFIGYRWPSEPGFKSAFKPALELMPTLLITLLVLGLSLGIITGFSLVFFKSLSLVLFSALIVLLLGITGYLLNLGSASNLFFNVACLFLFGVLLTIIPIFIKQLFQISFIFYGIVFVIIFGISFTAIILRMSNYFRDAYRANNYGVLDLVELFRQIDKYVFDIYLTKTIEANKKTLSAEIKKIIYSEDEKAVKLEKWAEIIKNVKLNVEAKSIEQKAINDVTKIKLSFIGHSMGCFVVTNTIRILSDVFDPSSVEKNPNEEIGRVFCLERLVLVAPDIPLETIIPRRGNFLQSSLRRFKEAYIFCNEGDIVLRILSTAANYFSFPAINRRWLYRLGNITAKFHKHKETNREKSYGIINMSKNDQGLMTVGKPYEYLELRTPDKENKISELQKFRSPEKTIKLSSVSSEEGSEEYINVADIFTYFDCTDYKDTTEGCNEVKGIVSEALQRPSLTFCNYLNLAILSLIKGSPDTHSGYFEGKFSKKIIYELAFLGFGKFINKLIKDDCYDFKNNVSNKIDYLDKLCQTKNIKVILTYKYNKKNLSKILAGSL
jgi:hypothetical protein